MSLDSIQNSNIRKMMQTHTPPIPPSPARLGLAQSPNPNPKQTSTVAGAAPSTFAGPSTIAAAAPSAALLPLLPPLPRAQALIPQMAALAAKLFDVSNHRPFWLSSYRGNLPSFYPGVSSAAGGRSAGAGASSAKEVLAVFASLQAQLFEAVAELQEILDLQDQRNKVSVEVRAIDGMLLAFTKKIRAAEQVLDNLIDDYADYQRDPKRSKMGQDQGSGSYSSLNSSLELDEILGYAHRISYTTFAPPEHGAGIAPLRGALPPAPQDNEMRASQLYHFADLDVGLPKKVVPEAKDRGGMDSAPEILLQPTPPREELPLPIPAPLLPISVPPGWKKGMPVELPLELPPVPPGWKPGDPITLPPDGLFIGAKAEEQRMPVVPAVAAPKVSEAIQVKYVQLDINPGQDDDSSEYSSEVGTSEEEDED